MKLLPYLQDAVDEMLGRCTRRHVLRFVCSAHIFDAPTVSTGNDHAEQDGYKSKYIKPSQYDSVDVSDIARSCTHLSLNQQNDLEQLLQKFPSLFDGNLKVYPDELISLRVNPDIKPHQSRPYPVPKIHESVFKAELDRLVRIGVLSPCGRSEWIAGSFVIPKKDGRVRWISDFRALNKALKREVYHIPKIGDILSRRSGYQFLSKLDISMQYYTFQLDDDSSKLCTIATPFGMYRYNRLPMGINQAPDIAQQVMEQVLRDIQDIEIYIDDIACFSSDWSSHLQLLDERLNPPSG